MNDEFTPEERTYNLAYNYQTLRCWLINHILTPDAPDSGQWAALKESAKDVLKETE